MARINNAIPGKKLTTGSILLSHIRAYTSGHSNKGRRRDTHRLGRYKHGLVPERRDARDFLPQAAHLNHLNRLSISQRLCVSTPGWPPCQRFGCRSLCPQMTSRCVLIIVILMLRHVFQVLDGLRLTWLSEHAIFCLSPCGSMVA